MKDLRSETIIAQTARDYDMNIETVRKIYHRSTGLDFYKNLEEELKRRREQ